MVTEKIVKLARGTLEIPENLIIGRKKFYRTSPQNYTSKNEVVTEKSVQFEKRTY